MKKVMTSIKAWHFLPKLVISCHFLSFPAMEHVGNQAFTNIKKPKLYSADSPIWTYLEEVLHFQPKNRPADQEVFGTQLCGQGELRDVRRRVEKFRPCSSRIFQPIEKRFKTRETRTSNVSWIFLPTKNAIFASDDYYRIPYRKTSDGSFFWMCWVIFYRKSYSNFTFSKILEVKFIMFARFAFREFWIFFRSVESSY